MPLDELKRPWDFPMPFTQSTLDYQVTFAGVKVARAVEDEVAEPARLDEPDERAPDQRHHDVDEFAQTDGLGGHTSTLR